tara:strand:+ start:163 stop:681 length:519 start_codon:yes stop_codon:yes gene_type:complete
MKYIKALVVLLVVLFPTLVFAENTVSSTVVTDKAPPTASAPSIVVNNSDVCKSAYSVAAQTGFVGIASGMTVTDENCERIKLSRGLFGMGMKVAAVSMLCQDVRVFDAMIMAGTPCPYKGKIGAEALAAWKKNPNEAPEGSNTLHEEGTPLTITINKYYVEETEEDLWSQSE